MKTIKVMDTTLRDAQQSLWATRMTTAMMLPVAEKMDAAGYEAIDVIGSVHFDVCVRYLKENPWDRVRLLRQRVRNTPLKAALRSKNLITFRPLPEDVVHLWVQNLVENGIRKMTPFDALFDFDNIIESMRIARRAGASVGAALVFCESPVHTDELYVRKTKELMERVGVSHIMLKDSGGLLTMDRVRTLVPALKQVLGDIPLELHSHCITGLAPLVYLEGVKAGADIVQTATAPLANGPSQPATQTIVRNLRQMGYEVDLDDRIVDEVGEYFRAVAEQEGKPLGVPMEYDAFHYEHQLPGGMLTNLQFQLQEARQLDKFDAVIAEIARMRGELGWPIMVTPFSQLVANQALFNVMTGERYKIVQDEMKQYALGYFGKLLAPVEPDVLDRIVENGSRSIALEPEPPEPALPKLRRQYPNATDEERIMRVMFPGNQIDAMLAAGPIRTDYSIRTPLIRLLDELAKRPKLARVYIENQEMRLEATANPSKAACSA